MHAIQLLSIKPINPQIFKDEKVVEDLLAPKAKPNAAKYASEDKIIQPPIKKRPYTEPIITRSPQKDKLEIW